MKKLFEWIQLQWWLLEYKINDIKDNIQENKLKQKYDDYTGNDQNNYFEMKHIWGIKSYDDLSGKDCNFYTMNDIDITYHRDTKKYLLGIETAYWFDEENRKINECKYLKGLLDAFTWYMDSNNLDKNYPYVLFCADGSTHMSANSIEELYTNFKIFVEGFCRVYESETQ